MYHFSNMFKIIETRITWSLLDRYFSTWNDLLLLPQLRNGDKESVNETEENMFIQLNQTNGQSNILCYFQTEVWNKRNTLCVCFTFSKASIEI